MSTAVIDELIETDDVAIDDELRSVELQLRTLADRQATLISIIEARGIHRNDGHRTIAAHLRATCNWSKPNHLPRTPPRPVDRRRPCRRRRTTKRTCQHLCRRPVGRCLQQPTRRTSRVESDRLFTDHAEHLSLAESKIRVDEFIALVEAARMAGIFERFCNIEYQTDLDTRRELHGDDADHHELPRTARQRRFDAMVAMMETANTALNENQVPGSGSDPVTNIIIDHDTLDETFTRAGVVLPDGDVLDVDGLIDTDPTGTAIDAFIAKIIANPDTLAKRHCRTAAGTAISPIIALRAAMLGRIRRVVVNSAGVVIDQGRTQRLFTHNARIAATLLATTCTHPGCNTPAAWCDVDHADEWSRDGGRTDQHNADTKCGDHDRFKHRERWRTRTSESGRPYSIRPDNTIVLPIGERPPDLSIDETNRLARQRLTQLRAS